MWGHPLRRQLKRDGVYMSWGDCTGWGKPSPCSPSAQNSGCLMFAIPMLTQYSDNNHAYKDTARANGAQQAELFI